MSSEQQPIILIADDDPDAREITADILSTQLYQIYFASNGLEALALARRHRPDLVLLDVMMPHVDGFEVCRSLRADQETAVIPVVMITALDDRDSRLRGIEAGADDFLHKPLDSLELRARVRTITQINRYRLLLAERTERELAAQAQAQALTEAYDTALAGWSRALDLRDKETEGHSQRVTSMTVALARSLGFSSSALKHAERGALLHDIGKLGIPDAILLKPGPLSDEEWVIMRRHPTYALDMLRPLAFLGPALDIPYCHHEKWDGSGYPRGLRETQIPLAARIFALADVWDALTNDRPYRKAWEVERSAAFIREQAGTHFDPDLIEPFLVIALSQEHRRSV